MKTKHKTKAYKQTIFKEFGTKTLLSLKFLVFGALEVITEKKNGYNTA